MKFSVGLQFNNPGFIDDIINCQDKVYEAYFSFGDFPNGRSSQLLNNNLLPFQMQQKQLEVLKTISAAKIPLSLLFNANCYGADSLSNDFYNRIGNTVDYLIGNYTLHSVTTTSPLIAKFIKANFPDITTRASVNMEIGTVEGFEYIQKDFDEYYIRRELNRDISALEKLCEWGKSNGKKMFGLANSGCLNYCSAHTFHDNLVAHEAEISKMDNAYNFSGVCKEFLKDKQNYKKLISYTNFIRPEDTQKYDGIFTALKLATRVHKNPASVLTAYANGRFSGNILDILEPAHNIYPYAIENGSPLKLVNMESALNKL